MNIIIFFIIVLLNSKQFQVESKSTKKRKKKHILSFRDIERRKEKKKKLPELTVNIFIHLYSSSCFILIYAEFTFLSFLTFLHVSSNFSVALLFLFILFRCRQKLFRKIRKKVDDKKEIMLPVINLAKQN